MLNTYDIKYLSAILTRRNEFRDEIHRRIHSEAVGLSHFKLPYHLFSWTKHRRLWVNKRIT
jgi:hypothetical protein